MACGKDMQSLYYTGLVGIIDPPRPGCRESIETVQSAGVAVKMITGDAFETASSIGLDLCIRFPFGLMSLLLGNKLHIYKPGDNALSGTQIDQLSDLELEQVISSIVVFYRASPRHKLRIVKVKPEFFFKLYKVIVRFRHFKIRVMWSQ